MLIALRNEWKNAGVVIDFSPSLCNCRRDSTRWFSDGAMMMCSSVEKEVGTMCNRDDCMRSCYGRYSLVPAINVKISDSREQLFEDKFEHKSLLSFLKSTFLCHNLILSSCASLRQLNWKIIFVQQAIKKKVGKFNCPSSLSCQGRVVW